MTDLEVQDVVARIKRAQAETDKLVDKGHKLRAEAGKFFDEAPKLRAEAGKLERDRELQPWQVFGTLLGAGAAFLGAGAVIGGLAVRLLTGH